jgi:hypothetical protein
MSAIIQDKRTQVPWHTHKHVHTQTHTHIHTHTHTHTLETQIHTHTHETEFIETEWFHMLYGTNFLRHRAQTRKHPTRRWRCCSSWSKSKRCLPWTDQVTPYWVFICNSQS